LHSTTVDHGDLIAVAHQVSNGAGAGCEEGWIFKAGTA
jgi:hypothetical protein